MTPGKLATNRLPELEGLRGLMAWWVVVGHLLYVFSDRLGYMSHNRSAVDVFIVLSGFVVYRLIDSKREVYGAFITRRFFRLYPAYLLIILLSAATLGLQREALTGSPFFNARTETRLEMFDAALANIWPHLAAHLTMLHGLVPSSLLHGAATTIVGQAWSISVEWQYYLLAPLVFFGVSKGWPGLVAIACGAAAIAALGYFGPLADNAAFIGPSVIWFAVGIASYYAYKHRQALPKTWAWAGIAALAVFGLVIRSPAGLLWSGMLVMILGLAPQLTDLPAALLRSRPMTWLGGVSYSTYMVHVLAMYMTMAALNQLHLGRLPYGAALTVISLGATLAISGLMWRVIEDPGMKFGASLAKRFTEASARRLARTNAVEESAW